MGSITKRKRKKGTVYRAEINLKGHPRITETFDLMSDAQRWVEDNESALRNGGYISNAPPGDMLFDDAIDRYLAEVARSSGLTQTDFCKKAGVAVKTFISWKRKENPVPPRPGNLKKVCAIGNYNPIWVRTGKGNKHVADDNDLSTGAYEELKYKTTPDSQKISTPKTFLWLARFRPGLRTATAGKSNTASKCQECHRTATR